MAGFAASYYREGNEAWLNDLVRDIVKHNGHIPHHSNGHDFDHQSIDTPCQPGATNAPANLCACFAPTAPALALSASSSPPVPVRASSVKQIHSAMPVISSMLESSDVTPTLSNAHHRNDESSLKRPEICSCSPTTPEYDRRESWQSLHTERTLPVHERHDSALASQRQMSSSTDSTMTTKPTVVRTTETTPRTSLGRTRAQQKLSISENAAFDSIRRVDSFQSDRSAQFFPHPGVRPFSERLSLGEAAGPIDEDAHEYPAPLALALIVIGICLSVFIVSVDRNVITTAIPKITEQFQSYKDIGWYGSAYFITASAFQPLYGRIYMSFDTRWSFLAALFIFEVGSVMGGASSSSMMLIIGRAIQGIGSAGILTGSFIVSTHSVKLQFRPVLFAVVGILYGTGALAGPLIGGLFTDLVNWRWVFWVNLPIGAVTFVGVFFFFKPRRAAVPKQHVSWISRILRLDLIGNVIFLGAAIQLFVALQLSESSGSWSAPPVVGLLCGCGGTIIIFIAWLFYKGDAALIPPRIVRQRTVAASCGAAFFIYGTIGIHAYYLPIWFQGIREDSAIGSGVNMIPYMLANALFSLIAGIFVSKNGLFAPPAIVGCAIGTIGCGLLSTLNQNSSASHYIGYEILISIGMGMAIQQGFSAVQTALPLEEVPIGTAAVVASQSLGGAVFVSVGNAVFQDSLLNSKNADSTLSAVDLREVLRQGATMFRSVVPAEFLPDLLTLYNQSLQKVFICAVAICGLAFCSSLAMEWRSVKTKQQLTREVKTEEIKTKPEENV